MHVCIIRSHVFDNYIYMSYAIAEFSHWPKFMPGTAAMRYGFRKFPTSSCRYILYTQNALWVSLKNPQREFVTAIRNTRRFSCCGYLLIIPTMRKIHNLNFTGNAYLCYITQKKCIEGIS